MAYQFFIAFILLYIDIYESYGALDCGIPESIDRIDFLTNKTDIPENNNNSIQYFLYTPEHPSEICYFEPLDTNQCLFNPRYKVKILIHGFTVQLVPGNYFEKIKNALLEHDKYNVIVVNWSKYSGDPYNQAAYNVYPVGRKVGEMMNFLVSNRGVSPLRMHVIGHSLGAHVAGVAGRKVPNLARVTGLDPAGPLFVTASILKRLSRASANFVDMLHSSDFRSGMGFGMNEPFGSVNFYPNGGIRQPACQYGSTYMDAEGTPQKVTNPSAVGFCNHDMALSYFLNSIQICYYLSIECPSYLLYLTGGCNSTSHPTNRMGFYSVKMRNLPRGSKFYLNTSGNPPYCEHE